MNKESFSNLSKKEWNLPFGNRLAGIIGSFSLIEKLIFYILAGAVIISGLLLLYRVNKNFLVDVPDFGGTIVEGVIGSPRFVNPVLASSDIDRDLTSLIYSGLLKISSDGNIINDAAESYEVSPDGLSYTIKLKEDLYFHDGVRLTADDVVFTIEKVQDPNIKSPRSGNWEGVRVEKIDERTLLFTLKQPYSPFMYNLTLGILPKHIWKNANNEEFPFSNYNVKPVGSGPYKIEGTSLSSSGLPNEYKLKSFSKYSLGRPFINNIVVKAYVNERDLIEAYKNGDVESMHSVSPKQMSVINTKNKNVILSPLPRIFGVFFNQNVAPVLVNKEVRVALDMITDKDEIIESILGGYGKVIDNPVPGKSLGLEKKDISDEERIKNAVAYLEKNGWKQNESGILQKKTGKGTTILDFAITTGDTPELKETAILLQKQWQKLGARVEVKIFEIGDLNQNIIKTRKYDALLFGEIIGKDMDLYPFWHSSERTHPGLNIAMYTNLKADKLLENIRKTSDLDKQDSLLNDFNQEIKNDIPAIFTYSPYFIYVVPQKVKNVEIGSLTYPGERFSDVNKWYIETNSVWKIFNN